MITFMSEIICVTNRILCETDFLTQLEKIASAKPDRIILREKDLSADEYSIIAEKALEICKKNGVICTLHTFTKVAVNLGANSIHLPLHILREISESDKRNFTEIGASCHSAEEAVEAVNLGASYITAGHVFATDCKKGLAPRGLDFLRAVTEAVAVPVFAIGGISAENFAEVIDAGACGACIMSGFMRSGNPLQLIKSLRGETNAE